MKGSIVQAAEGDRDAAKRAQALGSLLIEKARESSTPLPKRGEGNRAGAGEGNRGRAQKSSVTENLEQRGG
jgi:hypothetical protein